MFGLEQPNLTYTSLGKKKKKIAVTCYMWQIYVSLNLGSSEITFIYLFIFVF